MTDFESSDLVCRSRREPLSASDEQQLLRVLDRSEEAAWQADTLDQSERESVVQPGDDALVARIASRALKQGKSSGRLRIRARALQLAAAALLVGAMAGALGWSGVFESVSGSRAPSVKAPEPKVPQPALRPAEKRRPHDEPDPTVVSDPAAPESAHRAVTGASAAELLSQANLARREGRTDEARRSYQSIVRGHPRSREAPLAHLALGKMLEESDPKLALVHFRALAKGGGGLRAEGLWGLAECSRRLQRHEAEQEALRALVRDFPASSYAEAARGRVRDESP
jgi:TolA-binding protein